jgi:hypothetical protein
MTAAGDLNPGLRAPGRQPHERPQPFRISAPSKYALERPSSGIAHVPAFAAFRCRGVSHQQQLGLGGRRAPECPP